jgi:hypothetical protein
LGAVGFGKANVSVFHNARVEPFADQSKEYTVTHSLAEKRLQMLVIKCVEKLT